MKGWGQNGRPETLGGMLSNRNFKVFDLQNKQYTIYPIFYIILFRNTLQTILKRYNKTVCILKIKAIPKILTFTFYPKAGRGVKANIKTGNTAVAAFTDFWWGGAYKTNQLMPHFEFAQLTFFKQK